MKATTRNKNKEIDLIFSGSGFLMTDDEQGAVRFIFSAKEGVPPSIGEICGDAAVLESAWKAGHAILFAFGAEVHVQIAGFNMQNGALTVHAAPVFEALTMQIKIAA
jgi:hypothetical protein